MIVVLDADGLLKEYLILLFLIKCTKRVMVNPYHPFLRNIYSQFSYFLTSSGVEYILFQLDIE